MTSEHAYPSSGGDQWREMMAPLAHQSVFRFGCELFKRFARQRPLLMTACIGMFVASAFSGVAGIGLILPILDAVAGSKVSASGLSTIYRDLLHAVGLEVTLGVLLLTFAIMSMFEAALRMSYSSYLVKLGEDLRCELRAFVLERTTLGEWADIAESHSADAINAIVTESSYAAKSYVFVVKLIGSIIVIAAYLGLAMLVSPSLSIGVLVTVAASFLVAHPFLRKSSSVATLNVDNNSGIVESLNEHFAALRFLRSMALDAAARAKLKLRFQRSSRHFQKLLVYPLQLSFVFDVVVIVSICTLVFVAVKLLGLGAGEVAVLIAAFIRIVPHVSEVQKSFQALSTSQPSWHAISKLLVRSPDQKVQAGALIADLGKGIAFENVAISNKSGPVFEGVSFEIAAGEAALLKGPSGSGKSTIIDILVGLRAPTSGQVFVGGIPIQNLDLEDYRKKISLVPQDPLLSHDTIEANLRVASPNATEQDIWHALEAAGAAEFVRARRDGLRSHVGDAGSTVSGGQRQRIALARALLRRPQLLILDEPTSALDPKSEQYIFETIRRLRGNFTLLIVSHRAELIDFVDRTIDLAEFRARRKMPLSGD